MGIGLSYISLCSGWGPLLQAEHVLSRHVEVGGVLAIENHQRRRGEALPQDCLAADLISSGSYDF